MAEGKGENLKWIIGTVLTTLGLVFGSSWVDTYRARHLSYDVQPVPTSTGKVVLTIFNASDKSCGPAELAFKANANIVTARIRNQHSGDTVSVTGPVVTVETQRLAAANGRLVVDCVYKDLASNVLVLKPSDLRVGCGEFAYTVELSTTVGTSPRALWIVLGGIALVALIALLVSFFLLDPFRKV